ncbi:MAG: SDR family NAD(P)-dependent oxidoreductase, partial [Chloroflexi bacterium]
HRAQEPYVRYQDGKRWVREWQELSLHPTPAIPWKEGGCYLITGGAGGLARLFVQEIARQVQSATVILVGRSALTTQQRAQLDAAVLAGSASDIRIDYELVDVSDEPAVDALVQRVLAQYGHLDGIIHAAGVLRDSLLRNKTPEQVQAVLAPKVMGVEYLDKASQQIPLDFFILCSSLASVLGNMGQADYAAANAYLDAFAHQRQAQVLAGKRQGTTVSIDWPLWQAGGMQVQEETRQMMRMLLGAEMMGTETGMRMLYQALCSGSAQVLVVHGQVERIRQRLLARCESPVGKVPHRRETSQSSVLDHESGHMPASRNKPQPGNVPTDKLRNALLHIVSRMLKVRVEEIDVETPLSEYGFDSITFTQFANRLNQTYQLDLTPALFFEYSSLERLTQYLLEIYATVLAPHFVEGSPLASESVPVAPRGKTGEISQTERAFALTGHPQGMPRHGYEHPSQADSYPCRGIQRHLSPSLA